LAKDSHADTPAEKRLDELQRAELTERVKRRTMDLAWAVTRRSIESTARDVVDCILKRTFVSVDPQSVNAPTSSHGKLETLPAGATAEFQARADALVLIGGIFSGEKPSKTVEKAVDGLNQLATHASQARHQAGSIARNLLGGLVATGKGVASRLVTNSESHSIGGLSATWTQTCSGPAEASSAKAAASSPGVADGSFVLLPTAPDPSQEQQRHAANHAPNHAAATRNFDSGSAAMPMAAPPVPPASMRAFFCEVINPSP
jgi:hypothetical protein